MEPSKHSTSRLFIHTVIENKDDFEEKFERCYQCYQTVTSGLSEKEAHDALTRATLKEKGHEEMTIGLLVLVLSEPKNAAKAYRDLTLITRDGLALLMQQLNTLVVERYLRFNDVSRCQLLWLLRETIRTGVVNVDTLCWNVLRQAAGGDISPRNLQLIETLLEIFTEHRPWLEKNPFLLSSCVYTFLRLIEDHNSPGLLPLRQREVNFVVSLLRERFTECLAIGRDLLRLLQIAARIPEIDSLWKDILTNPRILAPTFTGIQQVMVMRTPRRYLQSRLTPEMEKKLNFFTSYVRFGAHKRYQDWFLKQYLMTAESQSLRIDLIRFIVGVIHPTNEQLNSDLIPRWAVIGWLLTTCTSTVAASNAKLAVFYDWLFFDADRDNIMNIEPAILVMSNSMRSHPAVTATLLDFMCRIIPNFYPPLQDQVRLGIFSSLRQILKMRVLSSLGPLFDSPKLDRDLRTKVRVTFKEFCLNAYQEGRADEVAAIIREEREAMEHASTHSDDLASFSDDEEVHTPNDDEDDIPLSKVMLKERPGGDERDLLDPEMQVAMDIIVNNPDNDARCEAMEKIVQLVVDDGDMDSETLCNISISLSHVLGKQFEDPVLPTTVNDETLEESIGKPLFVLFRNISQLPENDLRRKPLLSILVELKALQPKLGYLLLYFIIVSKVNEQKSLVYQSYCQLQEKNVLDCLLEDLRHCQDADTDLMCWLVPGLFHQYSPITKDNPAVIHTIVSVIDSLQLQRLITSVLLGQLVLVTPENIVSLIRKSLTWETWEQVCLWQLITAHGISLSAILPILPELEYTKHAEALTPIMLMLRQERPTAETMKQVLSRTASPTTDKFAVTILKYWAGEHEDKFAELVGSLLSSRFPGSSPNKRKRGPKISSSPSPPTAGQVLGHLDQLRQVCRLTEIHVYSCEPLQRALQTAQTHGTDAQRHTYADLFALVEVEDKRQSSRSRIADKSRSSKPKASLKEISDSSENSSEEEEVVKPKQAKKRKKLIGSDSD